MSLRQPKIRASRRDQQRARPALAPDAHVRVSPAAREVKRQVGPEAWVVLEEMALLHAERPSGPELCDETVVEVAERLGLGTATVTSHLADLRERGLLTGQRSPGGEDGGGGRLRVAIAPASGITPVPGRATDVSVINGQPVSRNNRTAREFALWLARLPEELRPSEIGGPWPELRPHGPFFSDAAHQNHVHWGHASRRDT